jgi:hypothetical protein
MRSGFTMQNIENTCGVNDTACTMHAVSLTPHAWCMRCHWHSCTMDKRFLRPWQPLKEIYQKHLHSIREIVLHPRIIREYEAEFKNSGVQRDCLMKKTKGRKSRDTFPLTLFIWCVPIQLFYRKCWGACFCRKTNGSSGLFTTTASTSSTNLQNCNTYMLMTQCHKNFIWHFRI